MKLLQVEMNASIRILIIFCLSLCCIQVNGQADEDPPAPPLFTMVTINQVTQETEVKWVLSPSPDVAGYVIYSYKNGEGTAIDTIFDPGATSYSFVWPWSLIRSESFVVAALDYSGNISPLSNDLNTIYAKAGIDTCNRRIILEWNKYPSSPMGVSGYDILISVDGGSYYPAGQTSDEMTVFISDEFIIDAHYCFMIQARLEDGTVSESNRTCIVASLPRGPRWINADYATVTESDEVSLSFTIDPDSEINLFSLEKKEPGGIFMEIDRINSSGGKVEYTDKSGNTGITNLYRLSAVNDCNVPVTTSNIASNIVLKITNGEEELLLFWNNYREWRGKILSYRVYIDTGNGFRELISLSSTDTLLSVSVPEIMYDVTGGQICFRVSASEISNPYGISGESVSNISCHEINELVRVPNIFSPDGDGINDLFLPVITFSPSDYHLLITNRHRKTVFQSRNFTEAWDGSDQGGSAPQDVYLWFLKVVTPSGRNITRTGTVTIIRNR